MAERKKIVGLAAIDRNIKAVTGVMDNLNDRVQDIAVAIVEHAAGDGNGDVSRALTLCQAIAKRRTLQVNFLIGWFRYFGNCNINLNANDGAGRVSLIKRDATGYRGFDVDGARANNWYDAFKADGERSNWYAGPAPQEYKPLTIGDLAMRMQNFSKNTTKLLDATKEVNGKEVPAVTLAEPDRKQVEHALAFIDRIAATLARHEDVHEAAEKLAEAQKALEQDAEVIEVIDKMVA